MVFLKLKIINFKGASLLWVSSKTLCLIFHVICSFLKRIPQCFKCQAPQNLFMGGGVRFGVELLERTCSSRSYKSF